MNKLKVAILEDSMELLKDLKLNLEKTGLIEVAAWATTSDEFFDKVAKVNPEALLLDIDLAGDSMTGIDVAYKLKLPVLFVSGKTKDYYIGIEELNMNSPIPVDHITKPVTIEKLNKLLPKFISEIRNSDKLQFISLNFGNLKGNKIPLNSIVFVNTNKEIGPGNKQIFFTDRKPEILVDISFPQMEDLGLIRQKFITTHKSYVVNADQIMNYDSSDHTVSLKCISQDGKTVIQKIPVSENYRKDVPVKRK